LQARDFLKLCFNRTPKDRPNATRLLTHRWLAGVHAPSNRGSSSVSFAASNQAQQLAYQQQLLTQAAAAVAAQAAPAASAVPHAQPAPAAAPAAVPGRVSPIGLGLGPIKEEVASLSTSMAIGPTAAPASQPPLQQQQQEQFDTLVSPPSDSHAQQQQPWQQQAPAAAPTGRLSALRRIRLSLKIANPCWPPVQRTNQM
jgi:hypothetical protein